MIDTGLPAIQNHFNATAVTAAAMYTTAAVYTHDGRRVPAMYTAVCVRIVHDKNKKIPLENFMTEIFYTLRLQSFSRRELVVLHI